MRHLLPLLLILALAACQPETSVKSLSNKVDDAAATAVPTQPPTAKSLPNITDDVGDTGIPTKRPTVTPTLMPAAAVSDAQLAQGVLAVEWRDDKHWLVALDPATGGLLSAAEPIPLGEEYYYAFAPEGRTLAVLAFTPKVTLHLIDLADWSATSAELSIRRPQYFSAVRFSSDGLKLAAASGDKQSKIYIVDLSTMTLTTNAEVSFLVREMQFTQDGAGLMLYGAPVKGSMAVTEGDPLVALVATDDLSLSWQMSFPDIKEGIYPKDAAEENVHTPGAAEMYLSGLAFAPDQDTLYIVHSDAQRLTTVDFSARTSATAEIKPQLSWLDRLMYLTAGVAHAKIMDGSTKEAVISPDGSRLYVTGMTNEFIPQDNGEFELVQTTLGLQSIRTSDGALLAEVPSEAVLSSIAADGSALYLSSYQYKTNLPITQIVDPQSLQIRHTFTGLEARPGQSLDGQPLVLAQRFNNSGKLISMATFTPDPITELGAWKPTHHFYWLTP